MSLRSQAMRFLSLTSMSAVVLMIGGFGMAAPAEKDKAKGKKKPALNLPPPSGVRMDAPTLAKYIDKAIEQKLKAEGVSPSPLTTDAEFVRRVSLDITGHIPSVERAAAFLDDKDPNKRAKLIDELLSSSDYGNHLADIWQVLMLPKSSDNRRLANGPMIKWLAEHFNKNMPWNKMVHDMLTATGEQDKNGAVTFFIANNTVDKVTDEVTKVFLGVQLQCAQCHNHPFTEWKQTEYWEMAAFFMKVQSSNPNKAAKEGTSPSVAESDNIRRGKNALPESAKMLAPKFLGGERPNVGKSGPVRPILADWLTTAQNPYFSKAMTNRIWGQYFGRGLVNPIDDMHEDNHASHPELLQELASQFGKNAFDVKFLVRAICNSKTYQRGSKPSGDNADAPANVYARMNVKVLSPEQLYDSLGTALGQQDGGRAQEGKKAAAGGKAGPNNGPRNVFVAFFGVDETVGVTEFQSGIPQALNLMNSARINQAVQNNPLVRATGKTPAEVIEKLYLGTLSRRPNAEELTKMAAYVQKSETPTKGYGDILWALLNSSEFTLNH